LTASGDKQSLLVFIIIEMTIFNGAECDKTRCLSRTTHHVVLSERPIVCIATFCMEMSIGAHPPAGTVRAILKAESNVQSI
jgi:hypothetical protein